jgi:hypothetical protein
MRKQINVDFDIGDIVYLKTDIDQYQRMVTGIVIRPSGIVYILAIAEMESDHFAFEISKEKVYIFANN